MDPGISSAHLPKDSTCFLGPAWGSNSSLDSCLALSLNKYDMLEVSGYEK